VTWASWLFLAEKALVIAGIAYVKLIVALAVLAIFGLSMITLPLLVGVGLVVGSAIIGVGLL